MIKVNGVLPVPAERILVDLMGLKTTRPSVIEARIGYIYDCIDGNKLDKAQNLLDELKADIGEDPELVRASILIKRKELIGK